MIVNLPEAEEVIRIVGQNLKRKILILSGGRPFQLDPDLFRKVGADATAASAWDSLETVQKLEEKW